jgi:hypothetical protein
MRRVAERTRGRHTRSAERLTASARRDELRQADIRSAPQPERTARAAAPAAAYATGESHPDGDERLPRDSAQQAAQEGVTIADALTPPSDSDDDSQAGYTGLASQPSSREMAQAAVMPHMLPLYSRSGHLIVPPPLRGSRDILMHQNRMADAAGLERIENDSELERLRITHRLVNLAETTGLRVNPELPANRRCARPWTVHFAENIARAYYARFGQPLELSSAVRTIAYQARLQRVNGNAAALTGATASPHLTGQAIDFGKKGMTVAEIAWMRAYLLPLMNLGVIDVEEEFQQACFHISVYRNYAVPRHADLAQMQVATPVHRHAASLEDAPESDR